MSGGYAMGVAFGLAVMLAAATPADALGANGCRVTQLAELPVTMTGRRPIIVGKFGNKDARFIVDSGAFYSTLSRASAAEFGLREQPLPIWFHVSGIGGEANSGYAVTDAFSLAGIKLPKIDFVVGGSDTGSAGLLGQNILGLADVEYDLPHGVVRLMKSQHCAKIGLAYWAKDKPFTMLPLIGESDGQFRPHTIATVLINGVKVRAEFDSGATSSVLSLAAAKRVGIAPGSPGVIPDGYSTGIGSRRVANWLATADKIDIGGEAISKPKIRIADIELGNAEMLVGADFFLTHRMFVSNANHVMFVTYEGGPVFGLSPKKAYSSDGTQLDLTDQATAPTTAEEYSRRGAALLSNYRIIDAISDFDKAVAMAPGESRYVYQRAIAHLDNRQRELGLEDLDKAITLASGDAEPRLTRAVIRLRAADHDGAIIDVRAADAALAPSAAQRLTLAGIYNQLDMPDAAINNYDLWLKSHVDDAARMTALNGRCWARALLNRDTDKALADCNAAIRLAPKQASYLDSRALIHVRRGELAAAMDDYDAAVAIDPRSAWSLYMRGLVEAKLGQSDKARADNAAALAIMPRVGDRVRKYGLEP